MSENELKQWMESINKGVWAGLAEAAPEMVESIGLRSAALLSSRGRKWFSLKPEKGLASAVAGHDNYTDSSNKTESEISAERRIDLPYGATVEYGNPKITTSNIAGRARVMWKLYMASGKDIRYKWAALSKKAVWNHPAYPFISPIYESYDSEMLERQVLPSIMKQLNAIPNLEIEVG